MSIKILPEALQNQIAAGEVLERPSSALKELLENSLDAKATNIRVNLENGGRRLIVQDNGKGMTAQELPLALTRHATSKIQNIQDLNTISSFGFRGEALPSIASVSHLTLTSIASGSSEGAFIDVEHGKITAQGPAAIAIGTKIEIRDLFANVPARLKFLKTPATENRRCQEVFYKMALAHQNVDFELVQAGKSGLRFLRNQDLFARLLIIWPPQITDKLLRVDYRQQEMGVSGFIGSPDTAQARADRIIFYINKRPVQNKVLLQALRQAYQGRLISKEYPQAVLFLNIPPQLVDVNAHPAKTEVRFQDERSLFSLLLKGVDQALSQYITAQLPASEKQEHKIESEAQPEPTRKFEQLQNYARLFETQPGPEIPSIQNTESLPSSDQYPEYIHEKRKISSVVQESPAPPAQNSINYLGQIANTYIILSIEDSLLLMDQHAAHERILFEKFRNSSPQRQRLAIAIEIPLHPAHKQQLEQIWEKLHDMGFILELCGPSNLAIKAIPSILSSSKAKEFINDALGGKDMDLDKLWTMLSCRSAIKAGDKLNSDEIMHLIQQWQECENKEFCPHGRPSIVRLNTNDLEKMFKRK